MWNLGFLKCPSPNKVKDTLKGEKNLLSNKVTTVHLTKILGQILK